MSGGIVDETVRLAWADHPPEKRREEAKAYVVRVLVAILTILIDAWVFMVCVGIVHELWIPHIPPIGFVASIAVVVAVRVVPVPRFPRRD